MSFDWHVLARYWPMLLEGLRDTVLITLLALAAGMVLGLGLCALSLRRRGVAFRAARLYVDLLRTVPEMVLIFWIYFCLPPLVDWTLSGFAAGVTALSLVAAAYLAEIFRAGIESVDRGQVEAATSLGMKRGAIMRRIVLPQAMVLILPPFTNFLIALIKDTSLALTITVPDIMYRAYDAANQSFRSMEIYAMAGAIYLAMCYPLSRLARWLERRRPPR